LNRANLFFPETIFFILNKMDVVKYFYLGWQDLMDNKSDPRTTNWLLMSSPFPTVAFCLMYVYVVKVIGPKLMENRKPFQLKGVMLVYNFVQVVFSFWLFYENCVSGWLTGYSYRCQPVDYSRSPIAMRMARIVWWYFISKFVEFLDTIFFIMRKKYEQVSALHVIHHGIMPFSVWWVAKYTPGGQSSFPIFLNAAVHTVMYLYYMLAAMGPKVQKYLWWKKYLTVMQIIQFVAVMTHAFQLFIWNPCQYPIAFTWWIGLHAVLFFFLFRHFYGKTYKSKGERTKTYERVVEGDQNSISNKEREKKE